MKHTAAPIVVAFSGGGDSLALLLLARAWADGNGRRLLAVTIDHRLRPESADWSLWCADRARRLGVEHQILAWDEEKPPTGVPAAARRARHLRLAEAARHNGAAVILMGHTADDALEAGRMRQDGARTPSPRPWSPSPLWPEGRGLFLLRPLIALRREALRLALAAIGETWIDDPGNLDPASPRARARASIAAATAALPVSSLVADAPPGPVAGEGPAGDLTFDLADLLAAADAAGILGAAVVCAAGAHAPPSRQSLDRLLDRLRAGEAFHGALAGARIHSDGRTLHLVRDAADHRRGGGGDLPLPRGQAVVWDGRFEIVADCDGARVGLLAGRMRRLPPALRAAVLAIPATTRAALPLVTHADGAMECPSAAPSARIRVRRLTLARLMAARGAIVDEAMSARMAETPCPS